MHSTRRIRSLTAAVMILSLSGFLMAWALLPGLAVDALVASYSRDESHSSRAPTLAGALHERFPLVRKDGPISTKFPNGVPVPGSGSMTPTANPEVEQLVRAAAREAGIGKLASGLLSTKDLENLWDEERDPYVYPHLDSVVATISDANVREKESELVELSSALMYAARPGAAFSLLSRMRETVISCPVQANLAASISLGNTPDQGILHREFEKAVGMCEDLPVVHAAYAKVALAFDTRPNIPGEGLVHIGRFSEVRRALGIVRGAQQKFPKSPILRATEATILLEVADRYRRAKRFPFATRAMYERALGLLDMLADVGAGDHYYSYGRARALAGLGGEESKKALEIMEDHVDGFSGRDAKYATARHRDVLLDLNRPSDAADLMSKEDDATSDLENEYSYMTDADCLSLFPFGNTGFVSSVGDPEPGWPSNCYVNFVDGTGNGYPSGADAIASMDYIPKYRSNVPKRDVLLFIAGRVSEIQDTALQALDARMDGRSRGVENIHPHDVESVQDALRRLERFEEAEHFLKFAMAANIAPSSYLADRLGEVLYLQENYTDAINQFRHSLRVEPDLDELGIGSGEEYVSVSLGRGWAAVKLAAAQWRQGGSDVTSTLLKMDTGTQFGYVNPEWEKVSLLVARDSLFGLLYLENGEFPAAVEVLERALQACEPYRHLDTDPCLSGVQENNLAIALARVDRLSDAAEAASNAINKDPYNPMFVEGLANILEQKGELEAAAEIYKLAIECDETQFTAQNNLGVLVARSSGPDRAIPYFASAVKARPDYSPAWFNLGLALESGGSLLGAIQSQGAFARASSAGPSLDNGSRDWITDTNVYVSEADLSKSLSRDWSSGVHRSLPPSGYSPVLLLGALFLLWRGFLSHLDSELVQKWLGFRIKRSTSRLAHRVSSRFVGFTNGVRRVARLPFVPGIVAVVCMGVCGFAPVGDSPWLLLFSVTAALLILGVFQSVRITQLEEPRRRNLLHGPGVLLGLLGMVLGKLLFIPIPISPEKLSRQARWSPYQALFGLTLVALLLNFVSRVPFVGAVTLMLLAMFTSGLAPVGPTDGRMLSKKMSSLIGILTLLAALAIW